MILDGRRSKKTHTIRVKDQFPLRGLQTGCPEWMNWSVDLEDSHFNTLYQFEHGVSSTVEVRTCPGWGAKLFKDLQPRCCPKVRLRRPTVGTFVGMLFHNGEQVAFRATYFRFHRWSVGAEYQHSTKALKQVGGVNSGVHKAVRISPAQ